MALNKAALENDLKSMFASRPKDDAEAAKKNGEHHLQFRGVGYRDDDRHRNVRDACRCGYYCGNRNGFFVLKNDVPKRPFLI